MRRLIPGEVRQAVAAWLACQDLVDGFLPMVVG